MKIQPFLVVRDDKAYSQYDNKCYGQLMTWGTTDNMRYCNSRPDSVNNIIKSMANTRIDNLAPSCSRTKGDMTQKSIRILYEWVDLNKENDNYNSAIDFRDPVTGLGKRSRRTEDG